MNEPMNKILVLGNGFDLAHYLPTKYDHFMTAMQAIVKSQNREIAFDELFADYLKNNDEFLLRAKELYKTDEFKLSESLVNKFKEKLENNSWFQYFHQHLKNTSNGIETWIDFENEIEKTFDILVNIFKQSDGENFISSNKMLSENFREIRIKFTHNIAINILSIFGVIKFDYKREYYNSLSNRYEYESVDKDYYDGGRRQSDYGVHCIINSSIDILNRYENKYTSFNKNKVFKIMVDSLIGFKEIFSLYISEVIDKLQPKNLFKIPKNLNNNLSAVFTFNYSESFQRFYGITPQLIDEVQHLHGNAKDGNIVLGIDDLNDELKPYKIYDFVKTHQKIINNTDFQFLDDYRIDFEKVDDFKARIVPSYKPYDIIVWGHSLDISDKEYIKDIFRINESLDSPKIYLIIWHYGTPHNSLANLIHIMGKDIIQNWVKKGWLKFEKMPDIYALNK